MKRLLAILFLFLGTSVCQAACPAGSTCENYNGTVPYDVTGGSTTRTPAARAVDNWREMPEAGIDCSGVADSTSALQAAINAMPDNSSLMAPIGCIIKLSSTITITNRVGITIESAQRSEQQTSSPEFMWSGSGSGPMFALTYADHPTFRGIVFNDPSPCALTSFLVFDGNGGSGNKTPTDALIEYNSFENCTPSNVSFAAISIAPTATTNHENYRIENNDFYCGGSTSTIRSFEAVTGSGSPNVSAADGAFTSADLNQPILLSWATGSLSTTVKTVSSTTAIVLNANAGASETNVTMYIGQAYGIGILVGNDGNAKDHKYVNNRITQCHYGMYLTTGSYDIRHIAGTRNDTMIYIAPVEPSMISFYQAEYDLRFVEEGASRSSLTILDTRVSNCQPRADGILFFDGIADVTVSGFNSECGGSPIQANAVVFGWNGSSSGYVSSIGNYYHPFTWAELNLTGAGGYISMNDVVYADTAIGLLMGGNSLPTSTSGLQTGQIWNNSGTLSVH